MEGLSQHHQQKKQHNQDAGNSAGVDAANQARRP
jgi:hypothetical protein